jgi:alanyl-tRNA synthetase
VRRALANAAPTGARAVGKRIADIAFDRHVVYGAHGREFKSFADDLKPQVGSGVVAVVSRSGGKAATIAVGVTPDLMDRFDKLNQWAPTPSAVEAAGRADLAQVGSGTCARRCGITAAEQANAARHEARPIRLVRFAGAERCVSGCPVLAKFFRTRNFDASLTLFCMMRSG